MGQYEVARLGEKKTQHSDIFLRRQLRGFVAMIIRGISIELRSILLFFSLLTSRSYFVEPQGAHTRVVDRFV